MDDRHSDDWNNGYEAGYSNASQDAGADADALFRVGWDTGYPRGFDDGCAYMFRIAKDILTPEEKQQLRDKLAKKRKADRRLHAR